jgi:acyl-CoA thioesterase FadM
VARCRAAAPTLSAMDGLDVYTWFHDVRIDESDFDDLDHIGNAAIARMLDDARTAWFRSLQGREPRRYVVVRHLSISYEGEARRGVRLQCAVRAVSRSRRSLLLDQALFETPSGKTVARARAVHVCFELDSRTAVPVWPSMIEGIERRQGEPLPFLEQASGSS